MRFVRSISVSIALCASLAGTAAAQSVVPSDLQLHGFVGEGAFLSTANDYIGASSRGDLAMFEAGLNVSTQITDKLHAGIQLYSRDVGKFRDLTPRVDWAYLDYRWQPWLGVRAGVIKMPFGLYNEYEDIAAARTSILLPQGVYPLRNRSALLAQIGFALYGEHELGKSGGSLSYQAWLGTLDVPRDALTLNGGSLDNIDTKYVTGAQVFWHTPIEGLRVGGSYLRTSIDFDVTLDPATIDALVMAGLVPPDFTGALVISQRPATQWVASAEYTHDDWLFAAEYGQADTHQESTLPSVLPTFDRTPESFYALASYRLCSCLEIGAYYSVLFADVHDRGGHDTMKFPRPFYAWQRDAAATVRYDVNTHWFWKLEAHFIDGAADLDLTINPKPERFWGLFLLDTTVTF